MSANSTRRGFLRSAAALGGLAVLSTQVRGESAAAGKLHLATNVYPWTQFYRRENRDFNASLEQSIAEVAASGVDGFEPILNSPADVERLGPLLQKHKLEMRSFYVNSTLHDAAEVEKSIATILAISEAAKKIGTRIVVTNPSPIKWGGPEDKNDEQLRRQAKALDELGGKLRAMGLVLAYHNHDAELRNAAREFHHMMVGTDARNVTLCLDAHWIYRGAGNSAVAAFDVLRLYGPRVTELHLRQSVNHVWTESLGEGDLDYPAMAEYLLEIGVKPHLVLEQSPEAATPKTLDAVEAHRRSRAYAAKVFAKFA